MGEIIIILGIERGEKRERERERDRQTDRQTDRQADRQADRHKCGRYGDGGGVGGAGAI